MITRLDETTRKLTILLLFTAVTFFASSCGTGILHSPNSTSPTNPIPTISSVSPTFIIAGSTDTTLTLIGSGLVSSTKVTFGNHSHTVIPINPQAATILVDASDLQIPGNYTVTVRNAEPGGGSTSFIFPVWQTLTDPTSGFSFSLPVFDGTTPQVVTEDEQFGDENIDPQFAAVGSKQYYEPFGFHVNPGPVHQTLIQWFETNVDINGLLLSSGAYRQQVLANGATAFVMDGAVGLPMAYMEANDGTHQLSSMYRLLDSGQVVSITQLDEPFPYAQDLDLGQLELNALSTAHF